MNKIHSTAIIEQNVKLGQNIIIEPYAVLGRGGFSWKRNKKLELTSVPQGAYGVQINDDVEIGSGTCIDGGSWHDTMIGKGVKLDNLIHIGHNAQIGDWSVIVAGVVIGGSCVIGKYCWLGMNACIKQHVKITNNVVVGAGAVVINDIKDDYDIVAGNPAKSIKDKVTATRLWDMAGHNTPNARKTE